MKYLIAGLGNIGAEYINTRHNIGFKVVEHLADKYEAAFEAKRLADYTMVKVKGKQLHLIKPTTYMNRSGRSVKYWMDHLNIPKENLLVVLDDLALEYGTIRLKAKGSNGGHNGLKDIDIYLGGNKYPRLRFGIGDNFSKGRQVDYVLGEWSEEENEWLPQLIEKSGDCIESFATTGIERTMNVFNTKS